MARDAAPRIDSDQCVAPSAVRKLGAIFTHCDAGRAHASLLFRFHLKENV
jgi:hypothetical protein